MYEGGLTSGSARTLAGGVVAGSVAVGRANTTSTSQTALSGRAAPPPPPSWDVPRALFVVGGIGIVGAIYAGNGAAIFFAALSLAGGVYAALRVLGPKTAEHTQQLARWRASFMCQRCGAIFGPASVGRS